jgi:tetratricopeptide (TPR) repeat protein
MRLALLALLLAAAASATGEANVWEDAIGEGAAAKDAYESELRQGDEHAILANTRNTSVREVKNQVGLAAASYRAATAARPDQAEPYFRLGRLLYSFYLECTDTNQRLYYSVLCNTRVLDRSKAEDVIAAWDAAEVRAPLDPRFSVGAFGESELLFRRAILHTKLATKEHLAAAAKDYEKILARQDSGADGSNETVMGNLAETYMMLGRLEESIETFKDALHGGAADTAVWYGFAVALDRDERTQQALDVIQSLGRSQRDQFHARVIRGDTFFVPEGEKFYYFGLVDEALGLEDDAINFWRLFLTSGAHPQFQPRAKAHLDALLKKRRKSTLPIEPPWKGILR